MKPIPLPSNQLHRFYAGGRRIDALRGVTPGADDRPEDWVGSTTTAFGSEEEGLSRLADGRVLRDLVRADPVAFLGEEHVARWGAEPGLLVKLLDAGERLPVHLHPGRGFAREHLGLDHGKTEAWLILEAEPGAEVHVGLREPADEPTVRGWLERQDAEEMLAALRPRAVAPGDAVLVPAGTLHAIGAGILLLELQEPTDLSITLEHRGRPGHLGLGYDTALSAVDRAPGTVELAPQLPADADQYFRAARVTGGAELEPAFAILVALSGEGVLRTQHGDALRLARGTTALVPHAAGATAIEGDVELIRCLPPAADAPDGRW